MCFPCFSAIVGGVYTAILSARVKQLENDIHVLSLVAPMYMYGTVTLSNGKLHCVSNV